MTEIGTLLAEMNTYILRSAEEAALYFKKMNISLEPFEGSKVDMDKDLCISLYKDLITEMIKGHHATIFKYGLFAVVVALRQSEGIAFTIHLGICFPHFVSTSDEDQFPARTPRNKPPIFDQS